MIIKDYTLKENLSVNDLIENGFNEAFDDKNKYYKCFCLKDDIGVMIEVIYDNGEIKLSDICVLDEDFGQLYTSFYLYKKGEIECFPFLQRIIEEYNYKMSNISCFIERN